MFCTADITDKNDKPNVVRNHILFKPFTISPGKINDVSEQNPTYSGKVNCTKCTGKVQYPFDFFLKNIFLKK